MKHASVRQATPNQPHRGYMGDQRLYLAPHKASLQLGDVGVCFIQLVQVRPLVLQLVVEQTQQLPRQVVVPAGGDRGGIQGGLGSLLWPCRLLKQLACRLPFSSSKSPAQD